MGDINSGGKRMKLEENMKKKEFIDRINKVDAKELRESIISHKFPPKKNKIIEGTLLGSIVLIVYLAVIFGALFFVARMEINDLNERIDVIDDIGESICVNKGGYIETEFFEGKVIIRCLDENIKVKRYD